MASSGTSWWFQPTNSVHRTLVGQALCRAPCLGGCIRYNLGPQLRVSWEFSPLRTLGRGVEEGNEAA